MTKWLIAIVIIFSWLVASTVALSAGLNERGTCSSGISSLATNGDVEFPIVLASVNSIKAVEVMIRYDGPDPKEIGFVPSPLLHEALVCPIEVNNVEKTILFSVAATGRVVSRNRNGILGILVFPADGAPKTLEVVGVRFVDEELALDELGLLALPKADAPRQTSSVQPSGPAIIEITQPFPNPGNPGVSMRYRIESTGRVDARVYDVKGALVWSRDERKVAGEHVLEWEGLRSDGTPVSSGVYFLRLSSNGIVRTQKITILK